MRLNHLCSIAAGLVGLSSAEPHCTLTKPSKQLIDLNCTTNRIRFVGIGDWGDQRNHEGVKAVRDGILAEAKNGTLDFALAVGDNFYDKGVKNVTDRIWTDVWVDRFHIGKDLQVPWIALLGNHDHYGNAGAQVAYGESDSAASKYWIMPDNFYSVNARGPANKMAKFVISDTMILNDTKQFDWIKQQVTDPAAATVLAVGHHQIYSHDSRGDNKDKPMVTLKQLLEAQSQVKAYICGHEHDMQVLRANNVDHFVIGGGGHSINASEKTKNTSAEVVYFQKKFGYAVFDLDLGTSELNVTYKVFDLQGRNFEQKVFTRDYGVSHNRSNHSDTVSPSPIAPVTSKPKTSSAAASAPPVLWTASISTIIIIINVIIRGTINHFTIS
ncbi:TPA: hypothetical protein N0F65_009476 [Lagenidium giganteum]|uniref:Calcineurin-like phosphoesterase domain-containing protein n=1 Tax=Lagenidium giganteum TaxID=4803 RepID=A0AAV2Z9X8_9STRA|nr:TPA: hypothetical protein N0F65_009476 [Lagenidium giganteum]